MDFSKINTFRNLKRIKWTEIANHIQMTRAGLDNSIKNEALKVRDLEKIAEYLEIPIEKFFKNDSDENIFLQRDGAQIVGNRNTVATGRSQAKAQKDQNNPMKELVTTRHEVEMLRLKLEAAERELKLKDEIIEMLKGK